MLKKMIIAMLSCMLLACVPNILAHAEPQSPSAVERTQEVKDMLQNFDSRYVDVEILNKLNVSETDSVIRLLLSAPEWTFSRSAFEVMIGPLDGHDFNIETIFAKIGHRGSTYLVVSNDNTIVGHYWITEVGEVREAITYGCIEGLLSAFLDEDFIKIISPDIVVENVFLFDGDMRLLPGIYYVTNMGDFMRFGDAIFPIADFMAFAEAAWRINVETDFGSGDDPNSPIDGGGVVIGDFDISQYRSWSNNFNPFAGVPEEIRNMVSSDENGENITSPPPTVPPERTPSPENNFPPDNNTPAPSILGITLPVFWGGIGALAILLAAGALWCYLKKKRTSGRILPTD